jgi:hypothetical protein|tara:strand:- start:3340 stop:3564 length:225 start_codon:yes stop_codon:yes gene_type:complete
MNITNKIYYQDVCNITSTRTDVSVEAECDNVKDKVSFDAYVATNKIRMKWNGKVYVGNMSGMEFTSIGPAVIRN